MPVSEVAIKGGTPPELVDAITQLRTNLGIAGDFDVATLADAEAAAAQSHAGKDLTAIEFVTIDPPTSMDLDQAMFIERAGDGYTVYYAIDDVAAWVRPGGEMDDASHVRGQTCYLPNERVGLYPPIISEGAASLLPQDPPRPAIVWTLQLDGAGALTSAHCERALVRSRAKLNYAEVQQQLDAGQASEPLQLLQVVGELRLQQEQARGGISLPLPEQEVTQVAPGDWRLSYAAPLPVENWNAQISLLTGMAAAEMMVAGKVGLLRTLPPPDPQSLRRLRNTARALHIAWPDSMSYPDFVRSLDPRQASHLAMLNNCTTLFRGAGYIAFNGELPDANLEHAALACRYAHTTAPLRRLIDRYVLEICVSLCAQQPVPQWVLDKLDALPQEMTDSDRREKKFERGLVDLVETLVLSSDVGQVFDAVVTEVDQQRHTARVAIAEPAVEGFLRGDAPLGQAIKVKLVEADLTTGRSTFVVAP